MSVLEFINKRKKALIAAVAFIVFTLVVVQRFLPTLADPDGGVLIFEEEYDEPIELTEEAVVHDNAPGVTLNELAEIFSGAETTYWDSWNWESGMIELLVSSVSFKEGYINGYVSRPAELAGPYRKFFVSCPKDQTVALGSENPVNNVLHSNFDLVSRAAPDDLVYAYCLDAECLNIGTKCVLVER